VGRSVSNVSDTPTRSTRRQRKAERERLFLVSSVVKRADFIEVAPPVAVAGWDADSLLAWLGDHRNDLPPRLS
jgi:hypothetical protein